MEQQLEYHEARAAHELSLGLTAKSIPAARAHLQLSSMHRERMRAIAGALGTSKPPLVMA
jgi:hypothetical protein